MNTESGVGERARRTKRALRTGKTLADLHQAQVINYLKASIIERGLLINFGTAKLEYQRLIRSADFDKRSAE